MSVLWLAFRDTTPVGHFTSGGGHDEFMAAYRQAMRDLPEPDATLDLRTGFGLVRMYRFDGADPARAPIVLLPGRAAASPMWAGNLSSLLRLRTVYTVDLLGEPGASIQNRPIESDADQARWLHEALTQMPEPGVHLLGVSIGGWTAMNLAIRQPEKIESVILLDPVMTFADLSLGAILRSIPVSVRQAPRSWRDGFNSWTANGAPVEDVPVAQMIESGMKNYVLKLPGPTRFSTRQLASVDKPVLVVMAGASVMHDSAAAARFAEENLKRGTVLTYEGASHAVNGEQPDRIATDVGRFLR
ncbi:pimeloyl-ACP methyl ester carboxylesterase [Sphaerisporangium rubeum]|uniref:Pimeloyl-ACP methyl ester carboxylesterase n=1 Tax=Sphaerisporangium rubeum TaxID=321317 RepID=A0A7X0IGH3_9ACTN|nr:alpha/beta hydrolase [Sphaerisporangium rubeum]MBB6474794.1 pimeloyl-ACP methyl ester carboxylesterase [Sphaerisporangium rubeum]